MDDYVVIEDSTLREGEQTSGVSFSFSQKENLLLKMAEANISYAEVGIPAMGKEAINEIKMLNSNKRIPILIGWNRGIKEDLDNSFEAGLKSIHIGLPSSSIHIKNKFKKDENWVIETATKLVEYAKECGANFISVSAEDMGRADISFLKKYSYYLYKAGAPRMRLSDTVGCLTPYKTFGIVSEIRAHTPNLALQMHMHNDMGLALANSLQGILAGASQLHVTINGLGDRAGITSLHQAAVALELLINKKSNVKLDCLYKLSNMVEDYTGLRISHNEPIVGSGVFSHESGIHVDGLLKEKKSFETFDPGIVNREHEFVIGKHTGSSAIIHILSKESVYITREQAREIIPYIREQCTKKVNARLTKEELIQLVEQKLSIDINTDNKGGIING